MGWVYKGIEGLVKAEWLKYLQMMRKITVIPKPVSLNPEQNPN